MGIMSNDNKAGHEIPPPPFAARLIDLYRRIEVCNDPDERYMLSREIAEVFAEDHDPTDHELAEEYHYYFEEFDKAKLAYDQAALKVARMAVQIVEQYLVRHNLSAEELCDPVPDRNSN